MNQGNKKQGFTLIELLIVIAIIGILSSVALATLNSARYKGADAATQSTLNNSTAQAEIFYDDNAGSYIGVCTAGNGIAKMHDGAANTAGGTDYVDCDDSAEEWRMKARSVVDNGKYFCIDSRGQSKTVVASWDDSGSEKVCP